MAKTKAQRLSDALDKVEEVRTEMAELRDEIQEAVDNMSGTNLENTERYQAYENAVDSLDTFCNELESSINDAEGIELP